MTLRISFPLTLVIATLSAPLCTTSHAQAPAPPADPIASRIQALLNGPPSAWTPEQLATMARIRDAALADPYALDQLRHLTANIGPRIAGSPQAQQAVEYVAAQMRALGAEVTLEKTTVPHWVRGTETGALTAWPGMAPGTTQKIVLTALGQSVGTPPDGLSAQVLVVNSFDELKALPPDAAKGKILLFNERFDQRLAAQGNGGQAYGQAVIYRGAGPGAAAAAGAVAVLVRSVGGADYRLPHTGMTYYPAGMPKIPAAAVAAEDADLLATLTAEGPVTMHLVLDMKMLPRAESFNVIADWKGAEHPEQIVIVSGHLDSWDLATGAIDDGAGIVVSMQAIHLLQKLGIHPLRTVRFVAWMDEEQGSDGARTYAQEHSGDLANHVAAIESDLGAGHPIGILAAGKPELTEWLRPVGHILNPIGASLVTSSDEAGEDISLLTAKAVPSFAPNQDSRTYFNYHHTPADTFDKVVPGELAENAAVMAVLAYALAESPHPAPR